MSMFSDLQAGLTDFYSANGMAETITLAGVSVLAIIGMPQASGEQYPEISNSDITASVRVSDVASISRGATAVVRGVTYRVVGDPLNDRLEWRLNLSREMVSL